MRSSLLVPILMVAFGPIDYPNIKPPKPNIGGVKRLAKAEEKRKRRAAKRT
jgi:hypothetical protein